MCLYVYTFTQLTTLPHNLVSFHLLSVCSGVYFFQYNQRVLLKRLRKRPANCQQIDAVTRR